MMTTNAVLFRTVMRQRRLLSSSSSSCCCARQPTQQQHRHEVTTRAARTLVTTTTRNGSLDETMRVPRHRCHFPSAVSFTTPLSWSSSSSLMGTCQMMTTTTTTTRRRHLSSTAVSEESEDTGSSASSAPQQQQQQQQQPYFLRRRAGVRNVAVIAHVDHGKTTLVDQLLRAASASTGGQQLEEEDAAASSTTTTTDSNANADAASLEVDRLLDSSDLEKERGITITSKVTRLVYNYQPKDNNHQPQRVIINCVDTPGHADFSAEVDRILSMVDGVVLVCDAAEGPKSQTKYVLSRAIQSNLTPLVVLNKCDRPDAMAQIDSGVTEHKLAALFESLGASPEQLEHRMMYASARSGWITEDPFHAIELSEQGFTTTATGPKNIDGEDFDVRIKVLLDTIMEAIPEPAVRSYNNNDDDNSKDSEGKPFEIGDAQKDPFSLAAVTVGYDNYLGRTCTGRIVSGSIKMNDSVTVIRRGKGDKAAAANKQQQQMESGDDTWMDEHNKVDENEVTPPTTVTGIFVHKGIHRTPLEDAVAFAGDIVTVSGIPDSMAVGDTLTTEKNPVLMPILTPPLAPPTLAMDFGANNGPLAGREGSKVASSNIRERLIQETDNNVTLKVEPSDTDSDKTTVYARGELQLGILIETMRREGFELVISPPRFLTKKCPDTGKELEPFEEVVVDVDEEFSSVVVGSLTGDRKGTLIETEVNPADGKVRLVFEVPSRGLLGFNSEIASATRGSAVVNHLFLEDREHVGQLGIGLEKGKLVANDAGKATTYALGSLSARGTLFVEPGDLVYSGMVIGENSRMGDMEVNPVKAKELTNMRTTAKDEKVFLAPPKRRSVEELIGYMAQDEVIEVTPQTIRLRKQILEGGERERAARKKGKIMKAMKPK